MALGDAVSLGMSALLEEEAKNGTWDICGTGQTTTKASFPDDHSTFHRQSCPQNPIPDCRDRFP